MNNKQKKNAFVERITHCQFTLNLRAIWVSTMKNSKQLSKRALVANAMKVILIYFNTHNEIQN